MQTHFDTRTAVKQYSHSPLRCLAEQRRQLREGAVTLSGMVRSVVSSCSRVTKQVAKPRWDRHKWLFLQRKGSQYTGLHINFQKMFQGDILEPIYRRANPPPALNPTRVEALCVINFVADETFRCSDAPVPEGNYLSMLLSDVTYPMRYRIAILHQYSYRMTAQGHL